jgi:hypothetical protein
VSVGYVVEGPIWKTTYRLVLGQGKDEKPYLQGWAVVESPSDEDWREVKMALVRGRPVPFRMDLDQPLDAPRALFPVLKWQVGISGGMALLSLLHTLLRGGHMWGPLLGLGGAGLAAHGAWPAIQPHLQQLLQTRTGPTPPTMPQAPMAITTAPAGGLPAQAGGPAHSGGLSPQGAARHPSVSSFFSPDGTPRYQDVVNAPDAEPSQAATLLSPEARGQLQQHLQGFMPNLAQSLGAKALGIDIEGQRKRMIGPFDLAVGPG